MKIRCRSCGNDEPGTFSFIALLSAVADQHDDGSWGDLVPAAIVNGRSSISCQSCGHSWRTRRSARDLEVGSW